MNSWQYRGGADEDMNKGVRLTSSLQSERETSGRHRRKGAESVGSGSVQSQFFLLVTHMHASAHTKQLFVYI